MKITILDTCTVTNGDVSLESIAKLGEVKFYDVIEPEKIPEVIGDSDAVICNKAKITKDIMDGAFFENSELLRAMQTAKNNPFPPFLIMA